MWYDDEAGPMVRPYTVTRGRTSPDDARAAGIDPVAVVRPAQKTDPARTAGAPLPGTPDALGDDHFALLELCRPGPLSVAELASRADLPLGVVRVLLGDLLRSGRIRVGGPEPPAEPPDVGLLRHVISGLKSL
nr:DUF742 domain-containing protein [Streptomyces sp. SID5468]